MKKKQMNNATVDYSDFEVTLQRLNTDLGEETVRLSKYEQLEAMQDRLPDEMTLIGSVDEEVSNWTSWAVEIHMYLLPWKGEGFSFALCAISWDDNWGRYDFECISRVKGVVDRSEAARVLIEDWLRTRKIDISEGSPYRSLLDD